MEVQVMTKHKPVDRSASFKSKDYVYKVFVLMLMRHKAIPAFFMIRRIILGIRASNKNKLLQPVIHWKSRYLFSLLFRFEPEYR